MQHKFLFILCFFILLQHQTPFPYCVAWNKIAKAANVCSLHAYGLQDPLIESDGKTKVKHMLPLQHEEALARNIKLKISITSENFSFTALPSWNKGFPARFRVKFSFVRKKRCKSSSLIRLLKCFWWITRDDLRHFEHPIVESMISNRIYASIPGEYGEMWFTVDLKRTEKILLITLVPLHRCRLSHK